MKKNVISERTLKKNRSYFETAWINDLQQVPKLRTYSILKSNYVVEKYITLDIPKYTYIRSTMSIYVQMRSASPTFRNRLFMDMIQTCLSLMTLQLLI